MFFKKKINSYTVVEAKGRHALIDKVNKRLNDNWVCIGGVQHIKTKLQGNQYDYVTTDLWIQAMGHKDKARADI